MRPARLVRLGDLNSSPPPLPQTPGLQVPGGRGPPRHGAGWRWRGSGSSGLQRTAAAAHRAPLDAKASGTDCVESADTAPGPAQGRDAGNRASSHAAPPPSWSLLSRENQSPSPCHRMSQAGAQECAPPGAAFLSAGTPLAPLLTNNPWGSSPEMPLSQNEGNAGGGGVDIFT